MFIITIIIILATALSVIAFCHRFVQEWFREDIRQSSGGFAAWPYMDQLPDEIVLNIFASLGHDEIVRCQLLSKRYNRLGRDREIWREQCFSRSHAARQSTHQLGTVTDDARLAALRQAMSGISRHETTASQTSSSRRDMQAKALADWDPKVPGENLDYYTDFIHRHAPIASPLWLKAPGNGNCHEGDVTATGVGLLRELNGFGARIVAPLEDGSICLWSILDADGANRTRKLIVGARSHTGLLTANYRSSNQLGASMHSKSIMTDTGAIECVSVNSRQERGYFAVQNLLKEIDLRTMQELSTRAYAFPITALSSAESGVPLTVGTTSTVHIYDARDIPQPAVNHDNLRCELIGGQRRSYAVLTQPGPLSILDDLNSNSILIAGRFTHILSYDRRFFPRLRGTIHSGARISSLSAISFATPRTTMDVPSSYASPSPFIESVSEPGTKIIAAGVYKGKGSLEAYGIDFGQHQMDPMSAPHVVSEYRNRQTASASKLLSIAPHNGTLVTSDADGNIKWFERDCRHRVRSFNINETGGDTSQVHFDGANPPSFNQVQSQAQTFLDGAAADMPGHGDIVQKLLPLYDLQCVSAGNSFSKPVQNPLLLWTGDGRVGLLNFGHQSAFAVAPPENDEEAHPYASPVREDSAVELTDEEKEARLHVNAQKSESQAREEAERRYANGMRRALEGQASEARFMTGLGLL